MEGRPPAWRDQLGTEEGGRGPRQGAGHMQRQRGRMQSLHVEQRGIHSQWVKAFQCQTDHRELILIAVGSH